MTENYPTMTRLVGHDATFEYNFVAGFNRRTWVERSAQRFSTRTVKIHSSSRLMRRAYFLELKYFIEQIAKGEAVDKALPRHSLYVMKVMEDSRVSRREESS